MEALEGIYNNNNLCSECKDPKHKETNNNINSRIIINNNSFNNRYYYNNNKLRVNKILNLLKMRKLNLIQEN